MAIYILTLRQHLSQNDYEDIVQLSIGAMRHDFYEINKLQEKYFKNNTRPLIQYKAYYRLLLIMYINLLSSGF